MKSILIAAALGVAAVSAGGFAMAQQIQGAPAASPPRVQIARVYVADMAKSEHFYRETFGLPAPQVYGATEHVFTLADGVRLALAVPDHPHGNGSFGLVVTDVDATMARAAASGGTITRAAANHGPARVGLVTDPDGTLLELLQPLPGAPSH